MRQFKKCLSGHWLIPWHTFFNCLRHSAIFGSLISAFLTSMVLESFHLFEALYWLSDFSAGFYFGGWYGTEVWLKSLAPPSHPGTHFGGGGQTWRSRLRDPSPGSKKASPGTPLKLKRHLSIRYFFQALKRFWTTILQGQEQSGHWTNLLILHVVQKKIQKSQKHIFWHFMKFWWD